MHRTISFPFLVIDARGFEILRTKSHSRGEYLTCHRIEFTNDTSFLGSDTCHSTSNTNFSAR